MAGGKFGLVVGPGHNGPLHPTKQSELDHAGPLMQLNVRKDCISQMLACRLFRIYLSLTMTSLIKKCLKFFLL